MLGILEGFSRPGQLWRIRRRRPPGLPKRGNTIPSAIIGHHGPWRRRTALARGKSSPPSEVATAGEPKPGLIPVGIPGKIRPT